MVEPGFSFLAPEIHKEFILRKVSVWLLLNSYKYQGMLSWTIKNKILEHNRYLDIVTFRVVNTPQFLGLIKLSPGSPFCESCESYFLSLCLYLSLFLSLCVCVRHRERLWELADNPQTEAERKLLFRKSNEQLYIFFWSCRQPTNHDGSKNKAGLWNDLISLRYVCNHGLRVANGKDVKVYA